MQADTTSTHLRAPDDLAPPDRRGSNGSAPPRKRAAPGEEDARKRPPKGRRGKAAKAPETQDEDLDSLIEQAGLPRRRSRFISKLTLRVLAINSLALVLLVGGLR